MSKDAQKTIVLTEDARKKLAEASEAFAACGFGSTGQPMETTFAEIEEFGHEVGRMVARLVEEFWRRSTPSIFRRRPTVPLVDLLANAKPTRPRKTKIQTPRGLNSKPQILPRAQDLSVTRP